MHQASCPREEGLMGTQGKQALLLLGSLLAFAFIPGLDRVTLEPQVS